jgi:hypothetical protein
LANNRVTKETGRKYLLLSLGAFAGLALEAVHAYGWEPLVYGGLSFRDYSVAQAVLHWVLTCLTWSLAGWFLINLARNKLGFDIFAKSVKMKPWQVAAVLLGIALSVTIQYFDWDGFKIIKEFEYNGAIKFIFQYIYYMIETAMFLLIIVFGQKAFDIWTKKRNVPWGGILCGLTWGISHLISRGYFDITNGLLSTISGFMFGAAYLLTNRDIKKSWLVLFLMFVL